MKTHNLLQGSPQWLAYRFEHHNASEAAAMLGLSKTTTRTELLHTMHTGIGKEFSAWVQRNVLDYGHEVEAMVRPLVEAMIGESLYPVTCSDGKLSASVDGLTMTDEIAFECKQWNAEIAAQVAAGEMPEQHMPQCQQIMMVTGAKKVIFAVGDGTPENLLTLDVMPDPAWFQRIKAGWVQFEEDLAAYTPAEVVIQPAANAVTALPAVSVQVSGAIAIRENFPAFEIALRDFIDHRLIRNPETDQDFADLESQIKALKNAEAALDAAEAQMLSQVETVDAAKRMKDMLYKLTRDNRLMAEKMLSARKETIRTEIVMTGREDLSMHLAALNKRIGKPLMPGIPVDFANAIKGKRTLDSMRDAVATELARAKIAANEIADKITLNLRALNEAPELAFLFSDVAVLALKDPEFVAMAIKNRIADHQAKESARLESERARIANEERIKAEAAATARANAEIAAAAAASQAQAAEAIAKAAAPEPVIVVHTDPVPQMEPEQTDTGATMRLGQIGERLGFQVTADFLSSLGFEPFATDKNAKLYKARVFPLICRELVRHIIHVSQGVTA